MLSIENLKENLKKSLSEGTISNKVMELRILCANEKSEDVLNLINNTLKLYEDSYNDRLIVDLYELKIKQLYHVKENIYVVEKLIKEMSQKAQEIGYSGGLALSYQIRGYLEFLKGNRIGSKIEISRAIKILKESPQIDRYSQIICYYSFAVDSWLSKRDYNTSSILEECADYFYQNGFYRSFIQCLSLLILIYQQTQAKTKSMDLVQKIFMNKTFLTKIPQEIKSNLFYFIGVSNKLNFNLRETEYFLLETIKNLKFIYQKNIYSGFYLRGLAHLTATYALQGKLELAYNQMIEVEELIKEGIATRNLDTFSKKQIEHDFNLTKFYIHSRLQTFQIDELQDLVQSILNNLNKQHSDAIFFSEFLLNANLSRKQLLEIKNLQNPSTKRVEHLINFLIEKSTSPKEKQIINLISILKKRPVEERMTLVERAFADLLAAQEYYKIERYAEIYPLLRKYENQLHRIEVLELRLFMEAFIQIGAFKNGDPMGPALQYVAIRKCQHYGFSRLENRLLNYLDLQAKDVFQR